MGMRREDNPNRGGGENKKEVKKIKDIQERQRGAEKGKRKK